MKATATTTLSSLRDSVAATLDLTAPVPVVIRDAIHRAALLPASHRSELVALRQIISNLRGPDGTPMMGLADYEETYLMQAKLFSRGQEEGSLRGFDTRMMAVTYQAAIDAMLGYLSEHPEVDTHKYAAALADFIIAGVANPSAMS